MDCSDYFNISATQFHGGVEQTVHRQSHYSSAWYLAQGDRYTNELFASLATRMQTKQHRRVQDVHTNTHLEEQITHKHSQNACQILHFNLIKPPHQAVCPHCYLPCQRFLLQGASLCMPLKGITRIRAKVRRACIRLCFQDNVEEKKHDCFIYHLIWIHTCLCISMLSP